MLLFLQNWPGAPICKVTAGIELTKWLTLILVIHGYCTSHLLRDISFIKFANTTIPYIAAYLVPHNLSTLGR